MLTGAASVPGFCFKKVWMSFSSFSLSSTSTTLTLKCFIALQSVSVSALLVGVKPFMINPDEKISC